MGSRFDQRTTAAATGRPGRAALRELLPPHRPGAHPDAAFDRLAKAMAEEVPRREALRRLGGGLAAVLLASLGLGRAWGQGSGSCIQARCRGLSGTPRENCNAACQQTGCRSNPGWVCQTGETTYVCCAEGTTCCSGACVNLGSDPNHCGSCDTTCTGGKSCMNGACQCPDTRTDCGGVCVDTATDPNHCGGCGTACTGGRSSCVNRECVCPSPLTWCSGSGGCVNLHRDRYNCGACGNQCTIHEACGEGQCSVP